MEQLQKDLVDLLWELPAITLWFIYHAYQKLKNSLVKVED